MPPLFRSFSSKSKKSAAETPQKNSHPPPPSSFKVISSSVAASRPGSSSAGNERPFEKQNHSAAKNTPGTTAAGVPPPRPSSRGPNSPTSSGRGDDISSVGLRTVPVQPVSGGNRNSIQSQPRSERFSYQQPHPRPASRGARPLSRSGPPPRMPSTRSAHHTQEGRRSAVPPSPRARRIPPQDGPYTSSSYNPPQRPSSRASVGSLESFATNPAVDRYPRPYVTPKNEFTNPTINGINPKRSGNYSRNQSMTSEFAATYSLEGIEGFPDTMPQTQRRPRGPVPQGEERNRMDSLAVPDGRVGRVRSFHGSASPGPRDGRNSVVPGNRGPGGMGMSMSMAGLDGLEGLNVGRRNRPAAPPVPRIPSVYNRSGPPSPRERDLRNGPRNGSQYPPPPPNMRPRNQQPYAPHFPGFDTSGAHGRDFHPPPMIKSPPPPRGQSQPMRVQRSPRGTPPPHAERKDSRRSMHGEDINMRRPPSQKFRRPAQDAPFLSSPEAPVIPTALPTPTLTPTPPSISNSQEGNRDSDSEAGPSEDAAEQKPPRPVSARIPEIPATRVYHEFQTGKAQDSYFMPRHHRRPSPLQDPQNTQPSSPGFECVTPTTASTPSTRANSFHYPLANQIKIQAPIMPGPQTDKCYTKDISLVMEECMMGHGSSSTAMKKTGNCHHRVGCMICTDFGDECGSGPSSGLTDAERRWLWLCSWCALRICGDCRLRLTEEENILTSEAHGAPIKVDLKGLREKVLGEKAAKQTEKQAKAPTLVEQDDSGRFEQMNEDVDGSSEAVVKKGFGYAREQEREREDDVSLGERDSGVEMVRSSEESISTFNTNDSFKDVSTVQVESGRRFVEAPPVRAQSVPTPPAPVQRVPTPSAPVKRVQVPTAPAEPVRAPNRAVQFAQGTHAPAPPVSEPPAERLLDHPPPRVSSKAAPAAEVNPVVGPVKKETISGPSFEPISETKPMPPVPEVRPVVVPVKTEVISTPSPAPKPKTQEPERPPSPFILPIDISFITALSDDYSPLNQKLSAPPRHSTMSPPPDSVARPAYGSFMSGAPISHSNTFTPNTFTPPPRQDSLNLAQQPSIAHATSSDAFVASLFGPTTAVPQTSTHAPEASKPSSPTSPTHRRMMMRRKPTTPVSPTSTTDAGKFFLPPLPFEAQAQTGNYGVSGQYERSEGATEKSGGYSRSKKWLKGLFGK